MASRRIDTRRTALRLSGHRPVHWPEVISAHQTSARFAADAPKTAPWRAAGVSAVIPKTPIESCTVKAEGHQREPASDGRPRVQIVIAIAETK